MPAKLDRCVQKVMKERGMSESRAWAICRASVEDSMIFDRNIPLQFKKNPVTGFLTANVNLARTGVQKYYGYEIGLLDRATELIGVLRPPQEVFKQDSIDSFVNLVVTNAHPSELVTVDNVKKLQKGQVSEVKKNGDMLKGIVTITDKDQIKEIEDGKVEVSVGYTNNLVAEKGTFDGEEYEYKQTDIIANHLAIVDTGRCGPLCKITTDKKDKNMKVATITIDGNNFEIEDIALALAIKDQQKKYKDQEEKVKEQEEEIEEYKKENDRMKAQKDALEKDRLDDAAINKLVAERAALLFTAKTILGDSMPDCMDCPEQIKVAVVDHVLPDMDLAEKSNEYISAAYDMAVIKYKKTKQSLNNLSRDFQSTNKPEVTRDSIRKNYMKEQLNLV